MVILSCSRVVPFARTALIALLFPYIYGWEVTYINIFFRRRSLPSASGHATTQSAEIFKVPNNNLSDDAIIQ